MEAQPLLVKFKPSDYKNLFCLVLTEVQSLIVKFNKFEPSGGHFLNYFLFSANGGSISSGVSGVNDNSDATLIVNGESVAAASETVDKEPVLSFFHLFNFKPN